MWGSDPCKETQKNSKNRTVKAFQWPTPVLSFTWKSSESPGLGHLLRELSQSGLYLTKAFKGPFQAWARKYIHDSPTVCRSQGHLPCSQRCSLLSFNCEGRRGDNCRFQLYTQTPGAQHRLQLFTAMRYASTLPNSSVPPCSRLWKLDINSAYLIGLFQGLSQC